LVVYDGDADRLSTGLGALFLICHGTIMARATSDSAQFLL
jgi:hypothetical protein